MMIMYNNKHKEEDHKFPGFATEQTPPPPPPPMSPRISFSNDFVETPMSSHQQIVSRNYRDAPVSSDFEFSSSSLLSKSNYDSMNMSASELFSHGRMLPLNESVIGKITTLRDELEADEDEDEDEDHGFSLRPPRNITTTTCSTKWKGFLGLRKSHIRSNKKIDTTQGILPTKAATQDKNINVGSSFHLP